MSTNHEVDGELARLRADLLDFVLKQTAAAMADDPGRPATAALLAAATEAVERGVKSAGFDAADIADEILRRLRPELQALAAHGVTPASAGETFALEDQAPQSDAPRPGSNIVDMLIGAGAAVVILLLGMTAGYFLGSGRIGGPPPPNIEQSADVYPAPPPEATVDGPPRARPGNTVEQP